MLFTDRPAVVVRFICGPCLHCLKSHCIPPVLTIASFIQSSAAGHSSTAMVGQSGCLEQSHRHIRDQSTSLWRSPTLTENFLVLPVPVGLQ